MDSYKRYKMQLRQTAYKLWISDLVNGNYVKQEGEWEPNYVQVHNMQISRVNMIGTVVNRFSSEDNSYSSITLDDSTSTIRLKTFREDTALLKDLQLGQIIMVIGKVREYNGELFVLPEIIKVLTNPNWELARKLELLKIYGKPIMQETQMIRVQEEVPEKEITIPRTMEAEEIVVDEEDMKENPKQKVYSVITSSDTISIKEVITKSGLSEQEAERIINELLEEGEIYEPKAGFLKSI